MVENHGDAPEKPNQILLGKEAAERFQASPGSKLEIKGESFKVTGVLESTGSQDDGLIIHESPYVSEALRQARYRWNGRNCGTMQELPNFRNCEAAFRQTANSESHGCSAGRRRSNGHTSQFPEVLLGHFRTRIVCRINGRVS